MAQAIHHRRFRIGTTAERTATTLPSDANGVMWWDTDIERMAVWTGDKWVLDKLSPFIVKNTSGATANAGDVGYLDDSNEYQTTTTAEDEQSKPCVAVQGGANNADIYVSRGPGRATLNYTGSAPSSGDYLEFSATAGNVQGNGTDFHPGVVALARAAGSGGTVEAELLLSTVEGSVALTNSVFQNNSARSSDSTWTGTIATLPGGADLTYTTSSGNEDCLPPNSTSLLAKMRLYNSTRSEYALIDDADTGTNTITLTASVPGTWATTDTITIDSQTNTSSLGSAKFMDFEITSSEIPTLARAVICEMAVNDTSAAGKSMRVHPWESNVAAKRAGTNTPGTTSAEEAHLLVIIPLISRRFCAAWTAGGASTALFRLRARSILVAA